VEDRTAADRAVAYLADRQQSRAASRIINQKFRYISLC